MQSKEERKAIQARLLELLPAVETELMEIPGVVGVGIGFKETGGRLLDEITYRVYVTEKKPEALLSESERIPATIRGVKTDVLVIERTENLSDNDRYRPVKGGIQIGNGSGYIGTLGCLAKRNSDDAWVILGNHHVMMHGGKTVADNVKIGQPDYEDCCCCSCGEIGVVVNASIGGLVDCAIATINSGTSHVNEITQIGQVRGTSSTVVGEVVRKRGRTTGLTSGTVVDINYPTTSNPSGLAYTNQIKILPVTGTPRFSNSGDSGSAVVNSDSEVVGLLWGGTETRSVANHIANVEIAMGITVQATVGAAASVPDDLLPAPVMYPELASATGWTWIDQHPAIALVERHQSEVIRLINHNRAVMVAWQRKQGPAFVAAFARSRREPDFIVPDEISGISLTNCLLSMYVALEENCSEPLRQDIRLYGLEAIQRLRSCASFAGLGEQLYALGLLMEEPLPAPLLVE
ncbi:MAG: hypothetical protein JW726_10000 [Anaerolineales bacterium]|nr:hypothetical protein [Anaerolineales bacterium]